MPPQGVFYQRIFHHRLLSSTINHPARTMIIRRHLTDRICLCLSSILLFSIIWQIAHSQYRFFRFSTYSVEELAYLQALNRSSPIIENVNLCKLDRVDILIVIMSASSHFMERQSIRETWGSLTDLFEIQSQRLFIIGYQPQGNFYSDLTKETKHESDLLYLTTDDHANTWKELHAYQWIDKYCPRVKYVFKTEDDLFVNSLLLHELVRELNNPPKTNQSRSLYNAPLDSLFQTKKPPNLDKFLFGWAYAPGQPERNNTASPYYVSRKEYSKETYPRYCSGRSSRFVHSYFHRFLV